VNFIFSNLNVIVLVIWLLFLALVAIRYFRPAWPVRALSSHWLIAIAIGLHLFYGLFVSWGQYYVWATSGDFTRIFINSPLPAEVPFWSWARPIFSNHLGYFLHYVLGRFWLNIFVLFLFSISLYFLFKIWRFYRGGFLAEGPELLLILMLISGWPGVLVSVSLGFILSIISLGFFYFKGKRVVNIEPIFIFATFFSLLFARSILNVLQ